MSLYPLNEIQIQLQALAQSFAMKEILPQAAKWDRQGEFPKELHQKARAAGFLNVNIPTEYGGVGFGSFEVSLVSEQLAYACVGIGAALNLNTLVIDALLLAGTPEQKKNYFAKFNAGSLAGYAMTEPEAGSDVAAIRTRAEKRGEFYFLNGAKTWISNATVADFFVVFAKTSESREGISAFLVDKNAPGLEIGRKLEKLGQKAFPAAELFLRDVKIPQTNILGKEGQGFLLAMQIFDRSRPMVGAIGVGLTKRCLDESVRYSQTRKTMDKPLASHQLVAAKIAEMGMRHEAAKLLTYQAALMVDQGQRNTLQAAYSKTFASDAAVWSASEAVQIFGGMGYSPEFPVEKLYRDAKVLQIYEGANEIQRLIMARELTRS